MSGVEQLELRLNTWGGSRKGAGRPPSTRPSVPHRSRPAHKARNPVLVTWRFRDGLPNLRSSRARAIVMTAIAIARDKFGMRVIEFSIQRDHVHLILEAEDAERLGKALRALGVRIARRLNALVGRRGSVFRERYHLRPLTTPKQVRNALAYVLCNFHKHRENVGDVPPDLIDECSSGLWFEGWEDARRFPRAGPPPVTRARTWLLRFGWKRWGLVRPSERPGAKPVRRAARAAASH